jgi:GSH-dependent disulfide-bond oxidoreductase
VITLYGMSSPNVRKVLIALEEIGLPYATEHVSVFRGEQYKPRILALNPMGKVPILIDQDGVNRGLPVFESGAILLFLAENYGPQFLPASPLDRYCVLQWLFMQAASMGPALGNHSHFRLIARDNAYAAARFRRMSAQVYRALDGRLAGSPYLGGAGYSVADMAAWPWARYFHRHGMRDADCPHLVEWIGRVGDRPAVRATDEPMNRFGRLDSLDRASASPEELAMFTGDHITAPTAEEAAAGTPTTARLNPWPDQDARP